MKLKKIARNKDCRQKLLFFSKIFLINFIGLLILNKKNDFSPILPVLAQDAFLNGIGYRE